MFLVLMEPLVLLPLFLLRSKLDKTDKNTTGNCYWQFPQTQNTAPNKTIELSVHLVESRILKIGLVVLQAELAQRMTEWGLCRRKSAIRSISNMYYTYCNNKNPTFLYLCFMFYLCKCQAMPYFYQLLLTASKIVHWFYLKQHVEDDGAREACKMVTGKFPV